jgi:hypothetical protein
MVIDELVSGFKVLSKDVEMAGDIMGVAFAVMLKSGLDESGRMWLTG